MGTLLTEFFNFEVMAAAWPMLFDGLLITLLLVVVVVPIGLCGGLGVALALTSGVSILRWITVPIVDIFRTIPPLVLLIFIYTALPFAGVTLSPFMSVVVAFLLNTSSFYGEIFRAGLESIGEGQREAAVSTGLSRRQVAIYILIPQATRNVLPDLISNTIEVIKMTSIASVVSLPELLYAADQARALTINSSPLIAVSIMYLMILLPIVRVLRNMEHKMAG